MDGQVEISLTYSGFEALVYPPNTKLARSYSSSKSGMDTGEAETHVGTMDGDHMAGSF